MPPARAFTDDSGHEVQVPLGPRQIVSLVPSVTETLFALGLSGRVAGVTKYCIHPREELRGLARVGGTKDPDIEKIASLEPDLILVNTEENRPADIEALRRIGPTFESFPKTVLEGARMVCSLGELTGTEARAGQIARDIEIEREGVAALAARYGKRRRVAYFIWKDPWMSVNGGTFTHDVLSLAGFENVYADRGEDYPETDLGELARRAPEIVLLSSEPYHFQLKHRNEFLEHEEIPAARMGRVYLVDGTYFCWHGVRQLEALRWVRSALLG